MNSSNSEYSDHQSKLDHSLSPEPDGSKQSRVLFRPSSVTTSHEREQWVLATILCLPIHDENWILTSPEYFQQVAENRRTDNLLLNETTHNMDHRQPCSIVRFLNCHLPRPNRDEEFPLEEYGSRQRIGYLICDALSTPDFPVFLFVCLHSSF
jgi:hypothetical protein